MESRGRGGVFAEHVGLDQVSCLVVDADPTV